MRVFAGVCGSLRNFAGVCEILREFAGVCEILRNFAGVCEILREFAGVCGSLRNFAGVCGKMHTCVITELHLLRVCNPLARSAGVFRVTHLEPETELRKRLHPSV